MFKVIEEANIRTFYTPSSKVPQVMSLFRSYGSLHPFNRQEYTDNKPWESCHVAICSSRNFSRLQYDWIHGYASSPRLMFPNIPCTCISEWLFLQNSLGFESYNVEKQWIFWSCFPFPQIINYYPLSHSGTPLIQSPIYEGFFFSQENVWQFLRDSQKKVAVIMRWLYYQGGRKAWFLCLG